MCTWVFPPLWPHPGNEPRSFANTLSKGSRTQASKVGERSPIPPAEGMRRTYMRRLTSPAVPGTRRCVTCLSARLGQPRQNRVLLTDVARIEASLSPRFCQVSWSFSDSPPQTHQTLFNVLPLVDTAPPGSGDSTQGPL